MDKRSAKTILKIYRGFSLVLKEKDFDKANVRDIIKASKISPTGFYAHFKSKEDVLQGLLAKLFLTVKIRGGFDLNSHLSLLFFRVQGDLDVWQGIVSLKENENALRLALLPWCRSFLPKGKEEAGVKLASELLSASLLYFIRHPEEKSPEQLSKILQTPLTTLLSA